MIRRAGTALLILTVALLLAGGAVAQTTTYTVVDIQVEGNRIATRSLILGVSSIHLGSPLTQTAIQETMHRLYGLNMFRDVQIHAEETTGGLTVVIVVQELPS